MCIRFRFGNYCLVKIMCDVCVSKVLENLSLSLPVIVSEAEGRDLDNSD